MEIGRCVCEVDKKEGIIELLQEEKESQAVLISLGEMFGGVAILNMEIGMQGKIRFD